MPSNVVKSFAEKTGKSVASVEKMWDEIIATVKKEYNISDGDEKLYKITTAILKKRLKLETRFTGFFRSLYG